MARFRTSIGFVVGHPLLHEGLSAVFRDSEAYEVVPKGPSTAEAVARHHLPDIMLIDVGVEGHCERLTAELLRVKPQMRVVLYGGRGDLEAIARGLEAGATSFLFKGSSAADLLAAVDSVRDRDALVSRQFARQVLNSLRERARRDELGRAARLNTRERQIAAFLLQARTRREIAANLSMTERAVSRYMVSLAAKLRAYNQQSEGSAGQEISIGAAPAAPADIGVSVPTKGRGSRTPKDLRISATSD